MVNKFKFWGSLGIGLLSILIILLTITFLEQATIMPNSPGYYIEPLSPMMMAILATIILSLISAVTSVIIKPIRLSVNGILLISVLFSVFIYYFVNVLITPNIELLSVKFLDGTYHDVTLTVTNTEKFVSLLVLLVSIAFIFYIVSVLPNFFHYDKFVIFFAVSFIFLSFIAVAYSVMNELPIYKNILRSGYSGGVPQSVFGNRNPYASFLLTGQLFLCFLYYKNEKKWYRHVFLYLMIPLVIAIHLTFSKTNLVLAYGIFLFLYYRRLFFLFKKNRILFVIEFILSSELIAFVLIFRFHPLARGTVMNQVFTNLFPAQLLLSGQKTLQARFKLWQYALTLLSSSPHIFLMGGGMYLSRITYFTRMNFELKGTYTYGFGDYHNGFVEIFHTFGLIGLIAYVGIFVFIFITLAKRVKTNRNLAYFSFVSLFVFIARSQTESLSLLTIKSEGIIASFAFVLPYLCLMRDSHKLGFSKLALKKDAI